MSGGDRADWIPEYVKGFSAENRPVFGRTDTCFRKHEPSLKMQPAPNHKKLKNLNILDTDDVEKRRSPAEGLFGSFIFRTFRR
jgi:hypothetical protein